MSEQNLELKLKQDFYKLHYPTSKKETAQKSRKKVRSNSVISVLQSSLSDELPKYEPVNPKGSIRKQLINRSHIYEGQWSPQTKMKKSFKEILSAGYIPNTHIKDQIGNLQITSMKDIEELGKKNGNVKKILQKSRDEKIKLNRIVLSYKQSQEIKLEYLRGKKEEVENTTKSEMKSLYDNYFKRQYESIYGASAQRKFQEKLSNLMTQMTKKIFMR